MLSPERAGHDGQGNGYRGGPAWRGHADHADDLLGLWALTMLAFLLDAALLTATANVAGSGGWPSPLATRTVTSYLLGGSPTPGTADVVCDISGR
jgi:hypothetical protein